MIPATPPPSQFWHEEEQCFYTDAMLSAFVTQGQLVGHEETVLHYFVPLYSHQTRCSIEIFLIDSADAR